MQREELKTGFVSIIGRTNVGKSTLINSLIKQKISITSRKPQTTRNRLVGIKTQGVYQALLVDTPGFHRGHKRALNRHMNRLALSSLYGVDTVLFMVEALKWQEDDDFILEKLPKDETKIILTINKVDRISNKQELLPFIKKISSKKEFLDVIPISALKGFNIKELEESMFDSLPQGEHLYPHDQVADVSERFLSSEVIREKCITRVGDEIPYRINVTIDEFKEKKDIVFIDATLYVEKKSQKGIVIGQQGRKLKSIGIAARKELEDMLQKKIMLKLWVKVKKNWTDNEALISLMGYKA